MTEPPYSDDDFVSVDPGTRTVLGRVALSDEGLPAKEQGHPWGTYRSMKRAYRLEGKRVEEDGDMTLDEALPKLLDDSL